MKYLERYSIEGDTPVIKILNSSNGILSRSEHVIFWLKQGGPPSNPKYYLQIDSEQVPWGKGEKYSSEESEIEPETISLQSFGAGWTFNWQQKADKVNYIKFKSPFSVVRYLFSVTDCLLHNEPASCGIWQGWVKYEAVAKASLNRAN